MSEEIQEAKEEYVLDEQGRINWRAMIPSEFIKVNKDAFKGKEAPTSTEGLEDNKLLILLGGIKWVAAKRGLIRRENKVDYVSDNKAVCTSTVHFSSSPENPQGLIYADSASATFDNTSGFGQLFLETIASNRAFVRAVRNALGINIVGQDEIAPTGNAVAEESASESENTGSHPYSVLRATAKRYFKSDPEKLEFANFKAYVESKAIKGVDISKWKDDWDSIPGEHCFILLNKMNASKKQK